MTCFIITKTQRKKILLDVDDLKVVGKLSHHMCVSVESNMLQRIHVLREHRHVSTVCVHVL